MDAIEFSLMAIAEFFQAVADRVAPTGPQGQAAPARSAPCPKKNS